MNALSTRLHPVCVARALRYPSYHRLAVQRALFPVLGSVLMGVGGLCSLGLGTLHGPDGVTVAATHVTHVAIVMPIAQKKAAHR